MYNRKDNSLNFLTAFQEFPNNYRLILNLKNNDGAITMRILMLSATQWQISDYILPFTFYSFLCSKHWKLSRQNCIKHKLYSKAVKIKNEFSRLESRERKRKYYGAKRIYSKETGNALYCWGLLWPQQRIFPIISFFKNKTENVQL